MTEKLDIGILSWNAPQALKRAITAVERNTVSDYRLFVIDNDSTDPEVKKVIDAKAVENPRIQPVYLPENIRYSGGVNWLLENAETQRVAYVDNDAYIQTEAWDAAMLNVMDRHHEVCMMFPGGGQYPIQRSHYQEILWGGGHCWMLARARYEEIGGFDGDIGHQNEVDYQTRLRLAGWKMACVPHVKVIHEAHQTNDPGRKQIMNEGIIEWVNKWAAYFGGNDINYHSPNVIRFHDWNVIALYMEEYFLQHLPNLNDNPEQVTIDGTVYDLIKVPRFPNLYRSRII